MWCFFSKVKKQKWKCFKNSSFFSLNYGSCSQGSSNFQRTFPLRKSGKEDVSETYDIRQVLPTTTTTSTIATPSTNTVNWKSSASTDRLSSQQTSSTASAPCIHVSGADATDTALALEEAVRHSAAGLSVETADTDSGRFRM